VLTWPLDAARPWQRVVDVDIDPCGNPIRLLQLGTVRGRPRLVLEMNAKGGRRWIGVPSSTRTCRELIE
jgi:hypothetical protein